MRVSLRYTFGVVFILTVIALVFRRVIADVDLVHAFLTPYYIDLWLFDLEWVWPFQVPLNDKIKAVEHTAREGALLCITFFSTIICLAVHIVGIVFLCFGIHSVFFKKH